jgi:flagellin domain protein
MADISLTASMRTNLLSLQNTQGLMDMTQERLSTGLKVNSAIDNAASYYTAQSLNNRANDLNALLDSMGQGIQTIQAANEGIEAITDFVEQAKAIANSARDVASKTDIKGLQTKFSDETAPADPKTDADTALEFAVTRTDGTALDQKLSDAIDAVNDALDTELGGKNLEDYVTAVKAAIEAGGEEFAKIVDIKVDNKTGKITFTAKAGYNIEATGAGDLAGLGKDPETGDPTDEVTSTVAVNTDRQKYALQFNEILEQIDNLAQDSGYKGINLLQMNTLTVIFNEDRSSQIEVKGTDASSVGLMLDEAVNNWQTNEDIEASIAQTEEAISSLRIMASDYGNYYSIVQNRQSFTKSLVNVLTEGADNLTLADMNEESANMLALQTRQQLAINSLSLASQAAQGVLQLF